jgi:prepilin-type N-terminal cleavage/methylation domain-containing protein
MDARPRSGRAASRRRAKFGGLGFTLIEILAVVAIFALLAGLLAPRVGAITGRALSESAARLAASLELARQRSALTGIPHRVLLDLDQGGWRLEWFVSEAEQEGREPEPPAEIDLRGQAPIPLAAPRGQAAEFRPLPGALGRTEWLEDSLSFAGVETPEGLAEEGEVVVEFDVDGTASDTTLQLGDESGRTLLLHVLPLADGVRIDAG